LRPEGTASCVRAGIEHGFLHNQIRRLWYMGPMFRHERPQKGRFREFFQFGVELIGSERPEADAEVVALASEMLESAGVKGELHVGHLGILRALLKDIPSEHHSMIMRLIDKKNHKALEEFLDEIDTPSDLKNRLLHIIGLSGTDAVQEVRELEGVKDTEQLSDFEALLDLLDTYGVEYTVTLGIARGLDYYTGMVFEIYCKELGAQSQVCGGGAYRLASLFGGEDVPATGFAIGFDRVMEICNAEPEEKNKVVVVCFDDTRKEGIVVARKLRKHVTTYVDVMGRRVRDQMSYANTIGASYAVIVGKEELDAGKVAFKDMHTGKQELLTLEEVEEYFSKG